MRIHRLIRTCLLWAALACCSGAWATGTCSVTSVTLSAVTYTNALVNASGTVNWTCTRTSNGTDSTPSLFNVTASAGLSYAGASRRVRHIGTSTTYMPYALSTASATIWGDPATVSSAASHLVTAAFATGAINSVSGSFPFTLAMAASLNPASGVAYTDTLSIGGSCTMNKNPGTNPCTVTPAALIITVNTSIVCSVQSLPGTVALSYTSFQALPAQGSLPFGANCSNATPYRMSVSPTGGTLLGLPYTLTLGTAAGSATDISSSSTYNLTGTGAATTYYINGSIAAGQSGICGTGSCTATSAPHTLSVEY